jgi:hypothetical protein
MIMKRWKLSDRKMAEAVFQDVASVIAKDAISLASIQLLIDLARESAEVTRAVRTEEVIDRARQELGLTR